MSVWKNLGKFVKDAWIEGVESARPKQWAGKLIQLDLAPARGLQKERKKATGGKDAKVVWVKFARDASAKKVFVLAHDGGHRLGELILDDHPEVTGALDSGVNIGACFIANDDGVWGAKLRLGDHRYNPKPFWK